MPRLNSFSRAFFDSALPSSTDSVSANPSFIRSAAKCPSPPCLCGQIRTHFDAISVPAVLSPKEVASRTFSGTSRRCSSGYSFKSHAIFSSSSAGANVQVEYASLPPGARHLTASFKISFCLAAHIATFSVLHSESAASSLRNIPSPEQGASTTTRSKNPGKSSAIFSGVSFKTSALEIPIRSIFSDKIFTRDGWISFAIKIPSPASASPSAVAFPPGAAHKSRTFSPGFACAMAAVIMAEGSCR